MPLFGRRKPKKLSNRHNKRPDIKSRRRISGKISMSAKASPYTGSNSYSHIKKRKKVRTIGTSRLAQPPNRLSINTFSKAKKILLILLLCFITGGIFFFLFFTDYFIIEDFRIYEEGTEITTNLELNSIVREQLADQNILLYNETPLSIELLKQKPEYDSAIVRKAFPKTIEIELEKYPVEANIINIIDSSDGLRIQKKYLVNTNGMIIMENEENPDLPYIRISTQQALGINAFPLDQEKLDYIVKLVNLFEEKFGLKIVEAVYIRKAREVHLRTEKDFDVWFDLNKNMLSQIEKLKRSLPKLDIYKTPLLYIDLRISGSNAEKVIFKRR
jgi:hypothetical protein